MYITSMNKYKTSGTTSLFSEQYRLEKLSSQGDPLERLNKVVKWEFFRETIEQLYSKKIVNAGPKPYDPLLMFKILILQRYYNLSDAQIEYQILDRLTQGKLILLSLGLLANTSHSILL